ncbi:proto-oncogene c-Fos-like [Pecten maximus]|uniref:proto-oncogene c-Fos-like n=1 Tax=Pecten maximus TaxID=6579 RepID=UPI0014585DFD|nr:proto-oncogene c-Fos-like [Pecten maximus]
MANSTIRNVNTEGFEEIDDANLVKAIEESRRDRSTMPLIKQELRYTILYRRMSSGQEEMVVGETSQPEYKLRNEEVRKLYRRREQNRQSSVRCRRRKKEYCKDLEKTITELEIKRCDLQSDMKRLDHEKKRLEKLVTRHLKYGECKYRTSIQSAVKQGQNGAGSHVFEDTFYVQSIHHPPSYQAPNQQSANHLAPNKQSANHLAANQQSAIHQIQNTAIPVRKCVMKKCSSIRTNSSQVNKVSLLSVQ